MSPITGPSQLGQARRIVVKVGSSSITGANMVHLDGLVDALAAAHGRGVEVVLVSSGAIATGMPLLQLDSRPSDLATQQAAAAVGQNALMVRYQSSLDRHGVTAGQVLLTAGDLKNPTPRQNAQRAMERLLSLRILPIVNENDTVATQEIRFGDNDRLAALVAMLVHADALVLLSDVDALYTRPPTEPGAVRIDHVAIDDELERIVIGATAVNSVGTGGAATKVASAKLAARAGIPVLLTSTSAVADAVGSPGLATGTWFEASSEPAPPVTASIRVVVDDAAVGDGALRDGAAVDVTADV